MRLTFQTGASAYRAGLSARERRSCIVAIWGRLEPGQVVKVRGKRQAVEREVTVAELLPRSADGPGFRDAAGDEYRRFYFDLAHGPTRPFQSRPRSLTRFEVIEEIRIIRTTEIRATSEEDAIARVDEGRMSGPVKKSREVVSTRVRRIDLEDLTDNSTSGDSPQAT